MIRSHERRLRLLVLLLVDGGIRKLDLYALVALRCIRFRALRLGELIQALGLAAHDALYLDLLLAGAVVAVDGFVDPAEVLDLPARIRELLGGGFGLGKVLVAADAANFLRQRDTL